MKPRTLDDFGGDSRASGNQINYQVCPECGSDNWKVYVNSGTGFWFCHAGQHQGGGRVEVGGEAHARQVGVAILDLLKTHGTTGTPPDPEVTLPPMEPLSGSAIRYLNQRGITTSQAKKWGLVEWTGEYRILIPYFNSSGKLVSWNSRRYSDHVGYGPKYKGAPGVKSLYVPERDSRDAGVALVEGPFDALAVAQHTSYRAISLGGKHLPKTLHKPLRDEIYDAILLKPGGEVVVALDGDAVADAVKLVQGFRVGKGIPIRVASFEPGEDPASVTPERLREVLNGE